MTEKLLIVMSNHEADENWMKETMLLVNILFYLAAD